MILAVNPTIDGDSAAHLVGHREQHLQGKLPPTRIRPEALAIALSQFLQPCGDIGDAALPGIVQRAAAKRREAGRKYGSGVE
jgi:hypothetical protein